MNAAHTPEDCNLPSPRHRFRVWAPEKDRMILHILEPFEARLEMHREPEGPPESEGAGGDAYFSLEVHDVGPGTRYAFTLEDGKDYPDPASHSQPEGVHGPSALVDHAAFPWRHPAGVSRPFGEWVIYELHVGTFTPAGTFSAVIGRLDDLRELGVNAIELMPVNQFPGARNWGYDGVYPYAVQNTYGGPAGLKELVDACHARGMAIILDVVYNHWGPEGAYAHRFGPYTTESYRTPWGKAINLDGPWSDGVRAFVIDNMRHWFEHYRIDALRVDAVHAIYDHGARSFWGEVRAAVDRWQEEWNRPLFLIAECDLNSPRVLQPPAMNGFGFDAQWLDDFHHALYAAVHREGRRHYRDFGSLPQLAKAMTQGFVHTGEFVSARRRRHGVSSAGIDASRFVAFIQNHDQIGNRIAGERLSVLVDAPRLKLAAAALLLSPYIPLLFMGEEYGETAPFLFFADYGDPGLSQAVREGRIREFERFEWGEGEPPDPCVASTFEASRLRWETREEGVHADILRWYRDLLALRKTPAMRNTARDGISVEVLGGAPLEEEGLNGSRGEGEARGTILEGRGLRVRRYGAPDPRGLPVAGDLPEVVAILNFSDADLETTLPAGKRWRRLLHAHAVGAVLTEVSSEERVVVEPYGVLVLGAEG